MHRVEVEIIKLFGHSEFSELRTSELVEKIFPIEYEDVREKLLSSDKVNVLEAKRKKAQLHRKMLYHINKLVDERFLYVSSIKGKGEKYFALNKQKILDSDQDEKVRSIFETTNESDHKKWVFGLEKYVKEGLVTIIDERNWMTKVNAIILRSVRDAKELYRRLNETYYAVNDVLGIVDFQEFIEHETIDEVLRFLKKINLDAVDYDKRISLSIDTTKKFNGNKLQSFIESFSTLSPTHISCVFLVDNKSLQLQTKLFKEIISSFSENKIRLHLQNKTLLDVPIIVGRGGTYSINSSHWQEFLLESDVVGLCVADVSVAIDLRKVYQNEEPIRLLKKLLNKTSRALIYETALQREHAATSFNKINLLNSPNEYQFFAYATSLIRLWNYDIDADYFDSLILQLQHSSKELEAFSRTQETIFRACGLPITMNIELSSAFRKFSKEFSKRKYNKITITSKKDLLSEKLRSHIERRQDLFSIFNSDRLRLFRAEGAQPKDVIEEFFILLELYRIPLFAYDFKKRQGELTLDTFFS